VKRILILLGILFAPSAFAKDSKYLSYDEFIRKVEFGEIQSVTLGEYSMIGGVMIDGETTRSIELFGDTGSSNDPLLLKYLKNHNVEIAIGEVPNERPIFSMLAGFLFMAFPIVILVLLIIVIKLLRRILAYLKDNQPSP